MAPSAVSIVAPMPAASTVLYAGLVTALFASTLCHADSGKPVEKHRRQAKGVYDYGGNGDLSKVEVDMTMEDYGEPPAKLRCHNCYLSVHGMYCMTMEDFSKIEMQECLDDEHYCMVQSLYTNNELTTFSRKCSRECDPGCESAGGNYKLEYCYSCCKEDFCNTGNGACPLQALPSLTSIPLLLPLLFSTLTLALRSLV